MNGLENIGVRLGLEDYQKIFSYLDSDNKEEIDFYKFCQLNTDKAKDTHNYLKELKRKFGEEIDNN
jgi:hypothetical protein